MGEGGEERWRERRRERWGRSSRSTNLICRNQRRTPSPPAPLISCSSMRHPDRSRSNHSESTNKSAVLDRRLRRLHVSVHLQAYRVLHLWAWPRGRDGWCPHSFVASGSRSISRRRTTVERRVWLTRLAVGVYHVVLQALFGLVPRWTHCRRKAHAYSHAGRQHTGAKRCRESRNLCGQEIDGFAVN